MSEVSISKCCRDSNCKIVFCGIFFLEKVAENFHHTDSISEERIVISQSSFEVRFRSISGNYSVIEIEIRCDIVREGGLYLSHTDDRLEIIGIFFYIGKKVFLRILILTEFEVGKCEDFFHFCIV